MLLGGAWGSTMSCIGHRLTIFTPIFTPTPRRETPLHPSTSNYHGEPWDVELYSYTSAVTLHLYTLYILHPSTPHLWRGGASGVGGCAVRGVADVIARGCCGERGLRRRRSPRAESVARSPVSTLNCSLASRQLALR